MTIRAELTGSTRASAAGITVTGHAPITRLCRRLIEAGHDPAARLEAYRGNTLSLRVRSIGEGAALTVKDSSTGRPRFVSYRAETCAAASQTAQTEVAATCAARSRTRGCLATPYPARHG